MNRGRHEGFDSHRSLKILNVLSENDSLTQRDISNRLGIALGLVNSYIKNLVKKGYLTVIAIPSKRYVYYLTPKGFAEKTRLTYDLLQDYTRIYREARKNLKNLFDEIHRDGARKIVFAGSDEVAEIAYITLQESNIELSGVVDMENQGTNFFGFIVQNMNAIKNLQWDSIVITSHLRREKIYQELMKHNVSEEKIKTIFRS
jgi:DNA-binding MarR family transcriptional regulator